MESVFGSASDDDRNQLFVNIIPILMNTLSSPFESVRIKTFKLFTEIAISLENPDQWESVPTFFEALKNTIFSVYENQRSDTECREVFKSIGSIIGDPHFAFINTFALEFLNFCLSIVSEESIPLSRRILVQFLLQRSLSVVLENDGGEGIDIAESFKKIVELTLQVCAEDRSSDDFVFSAQSIEELSFFVGYEGVQGIINELLEAETAEALQTALFLASSAFPAISQAVAVDYQFSLDLLKHGFSTEDQYIIEYSAMYLDNLISGCLPVIVNSFDGCVEMCINDACLSTLSVIAVLDTMIRSVKKQSSVAVDLLHEVVERMKAEGADQALVNEYIKLASTIMLYLEPSDELFEEMTPMIEALSENADYVINVPRFIAALSSVGPVAFAQNLGSILENLSALSGQSYELNMEVADALIRIVHRFQITCVEHAPAIVALLAEIFNTEKEEDDESEYYQKSRAEALRALGCVNKINSAAVAEVFENFNALLMEILQADDQTLSQGAIYALYECAEVNDCSEFISYFVQSEKFEAVLQPLMFMLINEVLLVGNRDIVLSQLGDVVTFFMARFLEISNIDELDKADQRTEYINCIFEAFTTLCRVSGANIRPFIEKSIDTFVELLECDSLIFRANSLYLLSVIVTNCIENQDLLKSLIIAAAQFSVEPSIETSAQGFNSLCLFVSLDGVLEDMEDPIQVALQAFNENKVALIPSCLAFLLSCAQLGAELPVPEFIDYVDTASFNNDQLVTVINKSAALGVLKQTVCILALSSEQYVWDQVCEQGKSIVAAISGMSEESMFTSVNWNEGKMQRIRERIESAQSK